MEFITDNGREGFWLNGKGAWVNEKEDIIGDKQKEINVNEYLDDPLNRGVMFLMDIDNFTQVNENYGHITGDHIICRLAEGDKDVILLHPKYDARDAILCMNVSKETFFANNQLSVYFTPADAIILTSVSKTGE